MCVVALFRLFHSQSQIKHTVLIHTVFFVHMMLVNIIWLMLQMYLQVYICQVGSLMPGCYITSSATGVFTQHVRLSLSKRREPYTSEGTFVHICFFVFNFKQKAGPDMYLRFCKMHCEQDKPGSSWSPFARDWYRPRVASLDPREQEERARTVTVHAR